MTFGLPGGGWGRLLLLAAGVVAAVVLCFGALGLTEVLLGIEDREFRYENKIDMWIPDADAGFTNKPNFEAFAWGTVEVRTDERGFRDNGGDTSQRSAPLVVGLGDSVMWGTGVSAADSFLGQLEAHLTVAGPVEVINAGVVGYSALQELRFFEKFVAPLAPDVVLLNFCNNDLMASEDPFVNVREIHAQYLEDALANAEVPMAAAQATARQMIALLRSDERAWPQIKAMRPAERTRMMQLLVERPIVQMVSMVRAAGGRFVLLVIPPRASDVEYARNARRLSRRVRAAGGEVIDLTPHLAFEPPLQFSKRSDWMPSVPAIERILRWRGIRAIHAQRDFIDALHPSRRGNQVVAAQVVSHLRATNWRKARP